MSEPQGADVDEPAPLADEGVGDRRIDEDAVDDDREDALSTADDTDDIDDVDDTDDTNDVDEADDRDEANRAPAPVAAAVLEHITRSVVDDPEAVYISAIPLRAGRVRLAVRVAPNDFGRLIGRRGRVAGAVRTLVGAAAVKDGVDVEVEFVE